MPKRANPFMGDYVQQSKVHLTMKHFNNSDNERLKKVHQKTLELLFKGAKRMLTPPCESKEAEPKSGNNGKNCLKQLLINKNGSLEHSTLNELEKRGIPTWCRCQSESEAGCAYCETPLCERCSTVCPHCVLVYCPHCVLLGSEETVVCISCCK